MTPFFKLTPAQIPLFFNENDIDLIFRKFPGNGCAGDSATYNQDMGFYVHKMILHQKLFGFLAGAGRVRSVAIGLDLVRIGLRYRRASYHDLDAVS